MKVQFEVKVLTLHLGLLQNNQDIMEYNASSEKCKIYKKYAIAIE